MSAAERRQCISPKANITVIPKNITKVYGDKPNFRLVPSMQTSLVSDDILLSLAENARFSCGGTAENAKVGQYDIVVVLGTYENENLTFTVDGTGTLDVTKAPLTVRVKDVSFEYGAEMPSLEPEFTGFKKTTKQKDVLGGIPEFFVQRNNKRKRRKNVYGTNKRKRIYVGQLRD
ncbi:MAG: hypothetical protein L6V93_15170 [Clostridiales bacterium]|nr:MAG: hypothetical protein L6V93_15170 [Clostridiales bacterium]